MNIGKFIFNKTTLSVVLLIALGGAALLWLRLTPEGAEQKYRTAPVKTGEVIPNSSAIYQKTISCSDLWAMVTT